MLFSSLLYLLLLQLGVLVKLIEEPGQFGLNSSRNSPKGIALIRRSDKSSQVIV